MLNYIIDFVGILSPCCKADIPQIANRAYLMKQLGNRVPFLLLHYQQGNSHCNFSISLHIPIEMICNRFYEEHWLM